MGKRLVLLIWIFFASLGFVQAQDDTTTVQVPIADTTLSSTEISEEEGSENEKINPLDTLPNTAFIHADTIEAWKKKKDFAYMAYLDSSLRAYQKSLEKPREEKSEGFFDLLLSSHIFTILMWGIAAFAVGFILYRLFSQRGILERSEREKAAEIVLTEDEQFLTQDFDHLANQAYKQQDYRLAVRYHFLQLLKRMDEKKMISFAIDKTNSSYQRELKTNKSEFGHLVRHYEYVWFGKARINEMQYLDIKNQFKAFTV